MARVPDETDPSEYPHWNRVYLLVVIYTAILIVLLWGFERMFTL